MARTGRARRWVIDRPERVALAVVMVLANLVGALVVMVLAVWMMPEGPVADTDRIRAINIAVFTGTLLLSIPVGLVWGGHRFRLPVREQDAERERDLVLHGPLRIVGVQGWLWAVSVAVFVVVNLRYSTRMAQSVGETILLGGITTCALSYLLGERILRRTAARVLAAQPPRRRVLPGVVGRSLLFWALGTGVPVIGLMLTSVSALVHDDVPAARLAVIVLAVAATALGAGLLVTVGAARAVADPVDAVREAMGRVERGDLDTSVTVYDGTELGQLQSGFNTMVAGLQERERIRDLFGRQVGRDVARAAAAAQEVRLGGEVRQVAVLFVDMVGSTALVALRPPGEVVDLLNHFFAVVVGVVEEHEGWINKFEGDAALAVFGAPVAGEDPAGCALAAGRELAARLARELPDGVVAGIGISAGDAVAGNVGDVRRYEYTVIGDPVNEAARLTELAKNEPGRVLAAGGAVALAGDAEAARWEVGDATMLRGRSDSTRLATPREGSAALGPPRLRRPGDRAPTP